MRALIFDCDGVLVDTERDGHRVAFNKAFADEGLEIEWSVDTYGHLLAVAGGKERMRHYFDEHGWPSGTGDRVDFIKNMHARKTELFMHIIESGELPLRSGVARFVDEAIKARAKLAVCSTSNERAVHSVVEKMLGKNRYAAFDEILAGDVVSNKKPDPEIYHLALERLKVRAEDCVVIEDSRNGLLAVKGAGMRCFVTTSAYTADENFTEADQVSSELGDPPDKCVSFNELIRLVL